MTSTFRNQRKNQNARQAAMISGLSTIYRNQTSTHAIQTHQQTEPRIFLLDITLDDINQMYSKIHNIIEKGRIRPKGTELFFVNKKRVSLILTEDAIYEIKREPSSSHTRPQSTHISHMNSNTSVEPVMNSCQTLLERTPIDGNITTVDLSITAFDETGTPLKTSIVPLLVDESYYKLTNLDYEFGRITGSHISSNHTVVQYMKIVVKLHPKSLNSFVFIMNDDETEVLDFYFTTENGIIGKNKEKITKTCKDDIISFIDHFKLCS